MKYDRRNKLFAATLGQLKIYRKLRTRRRIRAVLGKVIGGRVIKEKFDEVLMLHRFDHGEHNSQRVIRKLLPPR